ncbi:hypothetical protein BKA93DRAFT_748170 [Sparassis latifolia]
MQIVFGVPSPCMVGHGYPEARRLKQSVYHLPSGDYLYVDVALAIFCNLKLNLTTSRVFPRATIAQSPCQVEDVYDAKPSSRGRYCALTHIITLHMWPSMFRQHSLETLPDLSLSELGTKFIICRGSKFALVSGDCTLERPYLQNRPLGDVIRIFTSKLPTLLTISERGPQSDYIPRHSTSVCCDRIHGKYQATDAVMFSMSAAIRSLPLSGLAFNVEATKYASRTRAPSNSAYRDSGRSTTPSG